MSIRELDELINKIADKLEQLANEIRIAVVGFRQLTFSERKGLLPGIKRVGKAILLCIKAFGAEWWHQWGHIAFGWIVGGFIGLSLFLGACKIFLGY